MSTYISPRTVQGALGNNFTPIDPLELAKLGFLGAVDE